MEFSRSRNSACPTTPTAMELYIQRIRNFITEVAKAFRWLCPSWIHPTNCQCLCYSESATAQAPSRQAITNTSVLYWFQLQAFFKFPPADYSTVTICLHGSSKPLLWKLASLLEARLQSSCIRKLLDAGIDVVSDGNNSYAKFCFAIPRADISKNSFQATFKHLKRNL